MLKLDELIYGIPLSWNEETRGNERFTGKHPAAGQCTVSSLLIQRHCGGKIVRTEVGSGYAGIVHYFNELDGGIKIDVTGGQFKAISPYRKFKRDPDPSTYIFADTWDRVDLLESRVMDALAWR